MRLSSSYPRVDPLKVFATGHSFGAQAVLAYAAAGATLRGVVSLDSTFENESAETRDPAWAEVLFGSRAVQRTPVALFSTAEGTTNTNYKDGMSTADVVAIVTRGLDHEDFTATGGVLRHIASRESASSRCLSAGTRLPSATRKHGGR